MGISDLPPFFWDQRAWSPQARSSVGCAIHGVVYTPCPYCTTPPFQMGGWSCPGCGCGYSPQVLQCPHCPQQAAVPAEDFTGGFPAPVAYGEIEASHAVSDSCVPVSEGGLCDHGEDEDECIGGRHCSC